MAPSVLLDNTSTVVMSASKVPSASTPSSAQRTLLLAPPSISSHEEKLHGILSSHDRSVTDLQMLDRLSLALVSLPSATYDLILVLTDADGSRHESSRLLTRDVLARIASALKAGGQLQAQDARFTLVFGEAQVRESILAGLVVENGHVVKPLDNESNDAVPLRLRRKDKSEPAASIPAGVGLIDFDDDFGTPIIITGEDEDEDDELIDEDTLLTEEDLKRPVVVRKSPASMPRIVLIFVSAPECAPRAGKRRRACKDCTCGLAQKIAAEDAAKRQDADQGLQALKLDADDLAEVDFTVQGKVGSCGNCSLGDAFRCDGCPYIGLPAFKPGEEVRLLNNDIQL